MKVMRKVLSLLAPQLLKIGFRMESVSESCGFNILNRGDNFVYKISRD
jgi:hypothetical protein